jgi:hypothetical protein
MNATLTPLDWQKLSEYLDGQLTEADRPEVEKLLSITAEWQEAYQALDHTRVLLKSAPVRKAPHNFTLSLAVASQIRKPRRSNLFFRFSSAFSTALALLFLVLGFSLNRIPTVLPMAAAPAMQKSSVESQNTAIPIIVWGSPEMNPLYYSGRATGKGGGIGGGGGSGGGGDAVESSNVAGASISGATVPEVESTAVPAGSDAITDNSQALTPVPTEPAPAAAVPMNDSSQSLAPSPTQSLPPIGASPKQPAAAQEVITSEGPILGIGSTGPAPTVTQHLDQEPAPSSPPSTSQFNWWWVGAGGFLVFALMSVVMGWNLTRIFHR